MEQIRTVGVVGCGTMGTGIAIVCARAGFQTRLYDERAEAVARARQQADAFLEKSVERGKLPADRLDEIRASWHGTTQIADLSDCDIVIEAVFEDLAVKHRVLTRLNDLCAPHCIFASRDMISRDCSAPS